MLDQVLDIADRQADALGCRLPEARYIAYYRVSTARQGAYSA